MRELIFIKLLAAGWIEHEHDCGVLGEAMGVKVESLCSHWDYDMRVEVVDTSSMGRWRLGDMQSASQSYLYSLER